MKRPSYLLFLSYCASKWIELIEVGPIFFSPHPQTQTQVRKLIDVTIETKQLSREITIIGIELEKCSTHE